MSNLSYCIWGTFYIGVSGVFLGIYGMAPILRVVGTYKAAPPWRTRATGSPAPTATSSWRSR